MQPTKSAEVFAEWLRRQGYGVCRTNSSYWYSEGHGVYQAFPYHWLISPSRFELNELFSQHGARAVRYCSPADESAGYASYQVICQAHDLDLSCLNASTRRNVRDGLKKCVVERISFDRLLQEGWSIACETERRQGRRSSSFESWYHSNVTAADLEGFEVWGALVGESLVAFLVSFQMDDSCYMLYQRSSARYLTDHVNHALAFRWMNVMLGRPGVASIFNGIQPLDGSGSVDTFKFRLGYEAKPVQQHVVLHPWLAPFISRPIQGAFHLAARLLPYSRTLSKAEGLMRVHIAGLSAKAKRK